MDDEIIKKLDDFIKSHPGYRDYDISWGVCKKVYNHGWGSRDLFRIKDKEKKVYVAKGFANGADMRKINEFVKSLGEGWSVEMIDVDIKHQYDIIV